MYSRDFPFLPVLGFLGVLAFIVFIIYLLSVPSIKVIEVVDKGHQEGGFFKSSGYWVQALAWDPDDLNQLGEEVEYWNPTGFLTSDSEPIMSKLEIGHRYKIKVKNGDGYIYISDVVSPVSTAP